MEWVSQHTTKRGQRRPQIAQCAETKQNQAEHGDGGGTARISRDLSKHGCPSPPRSGPHTPHIIPSNYDVETSGMDARATQEQQTRARGSRTEGAAKRCDDAGTFVLTLEGGGSGEEEAGGPT